MTKFKYKLLCTGLSQLSRRFSAQMGCNHTRTGRKGHKLCSSGMMRRYWHSLNMIKNINGNCLLSYYVVSIIGSYNTLHH